VVDTWCEQRVFWLHVPGGISLFTVFIRVRSKTYQQKLIVQTFDDQGTYFFEDWLFIAAHTYLLQETKSEQNQFPSLFSTITLPQKTCSMDRYCFFILNTSEKMPTSSQYSGQSSPLWPFGHYFSMTILRFWCFHKQTYKWWIVHVYILYWRVYPLLREAQLWHIPLRVVFLGVLPRFVWHAECKTAQTAVTALNIITYVGESLQSSMVSRRLKGDRWPAILELKKNCLSQWEIHYDWGIYKHFVFSWGFSTARSSLGSGDGLHQFTMENHHFSWGNQRTKWPFSIAM
jgi:hypothetical protein